MKSEQGALLDPAHIACLRTFLALDDLELDLVAFLQALVAIVVDRAIVHEHIRTTIFTAYKAKAFRIVEPLYGSFQSHFFFLLAEPFSIPTPRMPV